jgi:23S rRNA (guanine2445-N2)-methyltransferase / 23S rRNA (guanine2069-N7)-methyltransferase
VASCNDPCLARNLDILVATAFGLESVVVRELEALGYASKPISTGRVLLTGDERAVARTNLWLRAADRVLVRVATFAAPDFEALFEGVKAIAWEEWIPRDFAFPVAGRSVKSQLSSVPAAQRAVKKAIVDRLMQAHRVHALPESGPTVPVEISLLDNIATLTIDTSGAGLHKRGYRPTVGEAAMKETLAAALVLLSTWRPNRPFVDPFCGTGTIAIEAAMIGRQMAPGLRREFAAEAWPAFSRETWGEARGEASSKALPALPITLHASDVNEVALGLARQHARAAGVEREIHFVKRDFAELSSTAEYGCMVTNPPYGVRLGEDEQIERLYRTIPTVLRRLPTWSFHILTARQDMEALVGQQASRRRKLFNSQIECTYYTFLGPKPPEMRKGRDLPAAEEESLRERNTLSALPPPAEGEVVESSRLTEGEAVAFEASKVPDLEEQPSPQRAPHERESDAPAFGGLRSRDTKEAEEFRSRLRKNVQHLRRYPNRGITCYRLYDRDCPDVPLIVDRYEDRVHVAEYEREHGRTFAQQADWFDLMRSIIAEEVGVPLAHVHVKEKHRQRGLTQHEKQGDLKNTIVAQEGGLKFEVNLTDYIDTGLFLDHRQTRQMVREQAAGKRFLNLFCYTGSFTVYAGAGGAASTTSVDLSNTYLDWAQRNLALNGLWPGQHRLVKSDVLEFLRGREDRESRYDLVVVDPPTFSNSKSTEEDWEVAKHHRDVFALLTPRLAPGAVVYFSNNYRRFKLDEELLRGLGYTIREITNQTIPADYRNKRIHRCWRLVLSGG